MKTIINFLLSLWKNKKKTPPQKDNTVVVNPPTPPETPPASELPSEPVRPSRPVVGVDVYHHDNVKSWPEIAKTQDFVILKVSESTGHKDTKFQVWRHQAKAAGLLVGYYHFFRTNRDPIAQANFFCDQIGAVSAKDLCFVCDYETEDDKADGFDILEVEKFLIQVELRLGVTPWIYSGHTLKQSGAAYKVPERFKKYPLWLAHYTNKEAPTVPAPWTEATLWQYTETANIRGIDNPKGTDHNKFKGTYEDLLKFSVK